MDTSPVKQRLCAICAICAMCAVLLTVPGVRADAAPQEVSAVSVGADSYEAYLASHDQTLPDAPTVSVEVADFAAPKGFAHTEVMEIADGRTRTVVHTGEDGYIEWKVNIETEAFYNISILYYPRAGKGASIVRRLLLDGALPFAEAGNIEFGRIYTNDGEIKTDSRGNQLRPAQVEAPGWLWMDVRDNLGYYPEPLRFYLSKGPYSPLGVTAGAADNRGDNAGSHRTAARLRGSETGVCRKRLPIGNGCLYRNTGRARCLEIR